LFGVGQARAAKMNNALGLGVGYNDIDPGHLGEMNIVGQSNDSVFKMPS
jgi:hypothetical protein